MFQLFPSLTSLNLSNFKTDNPGCYIDIKLNKVFIDNLYHK